MVLNRLSDLKFVKNGVSVKWYITKYAGIRH